MPRALSFYLPTWSIDLVKRRWKRAGSGPTEERPGGGPDGRNRRRRGDPAILPAVPPVVLLVRTVSGQQRVVHGCDRAAAAGVGPGMTLAHARALLPDGAVHVETHDEAREARALRALAGWALRFSPIVALDPAGGLFLDIGGCERLFHGERRLVNLIANSARWLGVSVRLAAAATYGCAWAVARFGEEERAVIPAGSEPAVLAPLPVEGLRLGEATSAALREVGIDRIGHLLELPRLELSARFDPDLLLRLDQATGEAFESIEPIRLRATPRVERTFDGPVKQLEAIMITVRDLLAALAGALEGIESGARQLDLVLERAGTGPARETIILSRPSRGPRHLWALLAPKVERIHLGAGVERVTLTATRTGRLPHEQAERWRAGGGDGAVLERALGELVDTLTSRLGSEGTRTAVAVESHRPERAFARHSISAGAVLRTPVSTVTPSDRPSVLFDRPEPIEVMALVPDGPPVRLGWRRATHTIVAAFGPERIGHEWWDGRTDERAGGGTRDYFRVQDHEGCWWWVYREFETRRWFVHGQWA